MTVKGKQDAVKYVRPVVKIIMDMIIYINLDRKNLNINTSQGKRYMNSQPVILAVDDDHDFLDYLKDVLCHNNGFSGY
ncbi:MAG: hypothetical protein JXA46_16165 [Dehalococcoidales bacterium]|nr:hypothetical protein [Dehalococcoidales bacterium]